MRTKQGGFTLLEVLVAFIIAALALGVLYQGALGGLLSTRIAAQYQDALSRGRSRLATIGHGSAIVPGEQAGDDGGGYRWRTRITAVEQPARPPGAAPAVPVPVLYAVTVAIGWGEGSAARSLQLDSRRVGFAAPAGP